MKYLYPTILLAFILLPCIGHAQERAANFPRKTEPVTALPDKNKLWIFIMAGQSNMAGRGFVEPQDTISSPRILTITKNNEWIYAKEPLHFYEPSLAGLDCGQSFAQEMLLHVDKSISIALIPCAVGGSSIQQWLGDSTHRDVKLLSNFKDKVDFAKKYGVIKGILWHQGESDAKPDLIPLYANNLTTLISVFRTHVGNKNLPVLVGELGPYAPPDEQAKWNSLITATYEAAKRNKNVYVISTMGLQDKGDKLHFNSASQREMGKRFAVKYWSVINKK